MNKILVLGICLLVFLVISSIRIQVTNKYDHNRFVAVLGILPFPESYVYEVEIPEQTEEDKALIQEFLQSDRGQTYRQELLEIFIKENKVLPVELILNEYTNDSLYNNFDYFILVNSTDNPAQVARIISCVLSCDTR